VVERGCKRARGEARRTARARRRLSQSARVQATTGCTHTNLSPRHRSNATVGLRSNALQERESERARHSSGREKSGRRQ